MAKGLFPIAPIFDVSVDNPSLTHYLDLIRENLNKLLPEELLDADLAPEVIRKKLQDLLPVIKTNIGENVPADVSFVCLCRYRTNVVKFFFNLISQWLVPGTLLNVVSIFAIDFRFALLGNEVFTLCHLIVRTENPEELRLIQQNWPILAPELRLGMDSAYYARKILEVKGVALDQKTVMIQQHIADLVKRMPRFFTTTIFNEMQHFFVLCHEEFKTQRTISHLSKLICAHYLFGKQLSAHIQKTPDKRLVLAKLFKPSVDFPQGKKQVLALVVGLNFLHGKELFEERHILMAVQQHVPQASVIDQTFFCHRKRTERVANAYVELEKSNGTAWSAEEIALLKKHLPKDIQNHVGRLISPVFMPRNEEEIMRNIVTLGEQLKYVRDIPQVFISFDEQTERHLFFTIIFVRILRKEDRPIHELMRDKNSFLHYFHDRSRIIGTIRNRHSKEATVYRVKFPKDSFLRGDHSVDLYKARQAVVNELSRIHGEFRDFNGGMISKQNELLTQVREQLALKRAKFNEVILENFFYSLSPIVVRTVLEPHAVHTLFEMFIEGQAKGLEAGQRCSLQAHYEPSFTYLLMVAQRRDLLEAFSHALHKAYPLSSDLVQGYLNSPELVSLGYIYRSPDLHKQAAFRATIEELKTRIAP